MTLVAPRAKYRSIRWLTDRNPLVSIGGSGDFHATIDPTDATIPPLSLVRVYGKVSAAMDGLPQVNVEYQDMAVADVHVYRPWRRRRQNKSRVGQILPALQERACL